MNEKGNEFIEVVGHDIYAIGTQVRSAHCYYYLSIDIKFNVTVCLSVCLSVFLSVYT